MSNSSSYLEVLRIPCTSKEKLLMDNSSTQKKRSLAKLCSASIQTHGICIKKSGTALLLFRYLRLWYCLCIRTSNTEAHADMYAHAHLIYFRCTEIDIHIPRTSKCCNVLDTIEFTRFQIAKHKAYLTPLLCLQSPHPKDIIPRRGLITVAKVQKDLQSCKF